MRYVYRGLVIAEYDTEKKEVTFPDDPDGGGAAIQHVRILPEDMKLLAEFFDNAHLHITNRAADADMTDIVVN